MREAAKAREIVDGVVQVYLPLPMRPTIVNVYLVRAGDRWTLVDTGMNTEPSVAAFRVRSPRSGFRRRRSRASSAPITTSTTSVPRSPIAS
jgi:glyoxylase-like metal-dependent hydrolase (beta-lactamase superfamily II)